MQSFLIQNSIIFSHQSLSIIISMQSSFRLFGIILLTLLLNQARAQGYEIVVKPIIQSIPQIENTYSVVLTFIYPRSVETRFDANRPADYFVQKNTITPNSAQTNEKKQVQVLNDENQVGNLRRKTVNPSTIPKKPQTASFALQQKQRPISTSLLAQNNKQNIAWSLPKLNPLSSFVVQDGVQHQILEVTTEGATAQPQQVQKVPLPTFSATTQKNKQPKTNPEQKLTKPASKSEPQPKIRPNQQTKVFQVQNERVQWNLSTLLGIIVGVLILVIVFMAIRGQRKTKRSSLSIHHSSLKSYNIEQIDEDEDQITKSNSSSLQDDQFEQENLGSEIKWKRTSLKY